MSLPILLLVLVQGRGVYDHVRTPRKHDDPATVAASAATPNVAGSQLSYSWCELEPSPGDYRWDVIEADLAPWAAQGKTCWIEIETAAKSTLAKDAAVTGYPDWILAAGVPIVEANQHRYPVFWNGAYLSLWFAFVDAFASRYDGDPRIEFVSTGGYSGGHEPNLSAEDNVALDAQWKACGFDDFIVGGVYLEQAIKPVIDRFAADFTMTRLAQTIHTQTDFDNAVIDHAASRGLMVVSNGMSAKIDAVMRATWKSRREEKGVPVAYAEWGPAGRGNPEKKLIDVYKTVIGDDADPALAPASRLSYVPLGGFRDDLETQEEWLAALAWAAAHLEPVSTQTVTPTPSPGPVETVASGAGRCSAAGGDASLIALAAWGLFLLHRSL